MPLRPVFFSVLCSCSGLMPFSPGWSQEKKGEETPAEDPGIHLSEDFEESEKEEVPGSFFVLEGTWTIDTEDGSKALKLSPEPLVEAQTLLGDSFRDIGGTIRARVKADRNRRSFPRFGIGLHGISGYRLRMVPVQNQIQLVKNEETVQAADLPWAPGEWFFLELTVKRAGDAWTIIGRAWPESAARPKKAAIDYISTETRFSGKALLCGTPYAGLPIWFDDIEVHQSEESGSDPEKEENQ